MNTAGASGDESLDFDHFEALTFDCYGTLIDWERGLLEALSTLLDRGDVGHGRLAADADELLAHFGRFESVAESGAFRPYRDVLRTVARRLGDQYGVTVGDDAADAFAASVGDWPAFPDTVDALRALSHRYRLAVVSNVDDDLFAGSAARLDVPFEHVVTAMQVKSYKPHRAHFDAVLQRLDLPRDRVLHVAQSLHHDIGPATALGFRCVWVNRRSGRAGSGATPAAVAEPDLEVPDLATLARLASAGRY